MGEAEIGLVYRARNLAAGATAELAGDLEKVAGKAGDVARRAGAAFGQLHSSLSAGIGMATETLASGGGLPEAAAQMGVFMAGQLAEEFAGGLLEKLAGSSIVAAIAAPLAGLGTAAGGFIAAAIPIGMAALPFILIGALVAAIAVLIVNEDIRNKVFSFVGGIAENIGRFLTQFLGGLPALVGELFGKAWQFVLDAVGWYIENVASLWLKIPAMLIGLGGDIMRTIIGGLSGLPGAVADAIRNAFASINVDIGPFHITGHGVTVDLPDIKIPGLARGVESFGGGMAVVNESGPELIRLPSGTEIVPSYRTSGAGTDGSGFVPATVPIVLDGRELGRAVDGVLYVRAQTRAGTTS